MMCHIIIREVLTTDSLTLPWCITLFSQCFHELVDTIHHQVCLNIRRHQGAVVTESLALDQLRQLQIHFNGFFVTNFIFHCQTPVLSYRRDRRACNGNVVRPSRKNNASASRGLPYSSDVSSPSGAP